MIELHPPMNTTDLFIHYAIPRKARGELLFLIVSSFAHSRRSRLLFMQSSPPQAGSDVRKVTSDDALTLTYTQHAVDTAAAAVDDLERYLGR